MLHGRPDQGHRADAIGRVDHQHEMFRQDAGQAMQPDMRIQADHRVGFDFRLGRAIDLRKNAVDDAAVLHVRRQKAQGVACRLAPGHLGPSGQRMVVAYEQAIALHIERHGDRPAHRLIVQVADPGVDREIAQIAQDFPRRLGQDRKGDARELLLHGMGQDRHGRQGRGNNPDHRPRRQFALQHRQFLFQRGTVLEDFMSPFEHPFALGRQAFVALPALDDGHAQFLFKLTDAARQGRLRHMAGLGGTGEMFLPGQGGKVLKLADIHRALGVIAGERANQGYYNLFRI